MFEHRSQKVLPRHLFLRRLLGFAGLAGALVAAALALGTIGYRWFAGFGWVDALLNAAMILTGMGPVGELRTTSAKLFAAGYALFSGLVFITVAGILLAPAVHRVLHRFHLDRGETADRRAPGAPP